MKRGSSKRHCHRHSKTQDGKEPPFFLQSWFILQIKSLFPIRQAKQLSEVCRAWNTVQRVCHTYLDGVWNDFVSLVDVEQHVVPWMVRFYDTILDDYLAETEFSRHGGKLACLESIAVHYLFFRQPGRAWCSWTGLHTVELNMSNMNVFPVLPQGPVSWPCLPNVRNTTLDYLPLRPCSETRNKFCQIAAGFVLATNNLTSLAIRVNLFRCGTSHDEVAVIDAINTRYATGLALDSLVLPAGFDGMKILKVSCRLLTLQCASHEAEVSNIREGWNKGWNVPKLDGCRAEEVIIHGKWLAVEPDLLLPSGIRSLHFRQPYNDRHPQASDPSWYQEIVFEGEWLDRLACSLKILDLGPYTLRKWQYRRLQALTLDHLHTRVWNREDRVALEQSAFVHDSTTTHICESSNL